MNKVIISDFNSFVPNSPIETIFKLIVLHYEFLIKVQQNTVRNCSETLFAYIKRDNDNYKDTFFSSPDKFAKEILNVIIDNI